MSGRSPRTGTASPATARVEPDGDPLVVRRRRGLTSVGAVRHGRPSCYWITDGAAPPPASSGPGGRLEVRTDVELIGPSPPWRCQAVFLRVCFDDLRVRAVDAALDGPPRAAPPALSISGLGSNSVGWYLAVTGEAPHELAVRALLDAPDGLTRLTGIVRVEMPVVRDRFPRWRAHAGSPVLREFSLPVRAVPPGVRTGAGRAPHREQPGAVRLCLAADIERYSRFRTPEAIRAQERFLDVLAQARAHAGIGEAQVDAVESGDGQFVVLPSGLDESTAIPALVRGLRIALARTNADLNERARLRLRIALHRGHMTLGSNGWVGDSTIAVHRLLDSPPARRALVEHPESDFVLIVSDTLYSDVIAHGYDLLRPEAFTAVDVDMAAKNFHARAWLYVPGGPAEP